jgi:hypothetical protein
MKTIIFFLVSMFFLASCGDNQRSGNRVPKSQTESGSVAVKTADDSISRLYNSAYSSYMDFFAELEVDYVYGEGDSGEMRKSYTFVDGDGENVTIEVRSDSSIAVHRSDKIYEILVDEYEKFVYWAKAHTKTQSIEYRWLVDSVELSSFGDLQHALLLPTQMLNEAKTASLEQRDKENVVRRETLSEMANQFRQ